MPEIVPMLCLSTGHLPEAIRRDLDAVAAPGTDFAADDWRSRILATAWFDHGWIVYVPEDGVEDDDIPMPTAVRACLAFARRHRASFLKFDCDVQPLAQLPFFEDEPAPSTR